MTNVPTNSTDDALNTAAVEQPEKTEVHPAAVVENPKEESLKEADEAVANDSEPQRETAAVDASLPETAPTGTESADSAVPEPEADEESEEKAVPASKEAVIERLQVLAAHPEQSETSELNLLKQTFYRYIKEEKQKAYNKFVKDGGNAEEFRPEAESLEKDFKELMGVVREHRAKIQEAVEKQKEANLKKKQVIIEKIKALAASPEEASKNYNEFRKLQDEWKDINPIPQSSANEAWKSFQFTIEQYYDLLKENDALRDYDFKKNLEAKTRLCEEAEKLMDNPDIIQASHQLQQLHQEFREIGPVAKELRESLWERFKTASSAVNKRQAQYFEELKAKEEDNLARKTALCEELENNEVTNIKSTTDWE